ncbi:MAG TPA: hypothetical protein VLA92_01005, partial [Candidatus Saccharimonadales bacterium]|nr:hypothetical protein [Candidatus Saccharimonadales bacterium]
IVKQICVIISVMTSSKTLDPKGNKWTVRLYILRRPITVTTTCNGRTHSFKTHGIRQAFQLKSKLIADIKRGDAPFRP